VIEGFLHLFQARSPFQVLIDLVDLLVVTYVIYRALLVLRGTRAMQMGTGLGVIFVVYVIAKWAGFITLVNLLSSLLSSIILVVVVVFQNDIRRGLMRVGSRAFLGGINRMQETKVIDEVVAAATELARHRMGALICFEQDANLDEFVVGQGTQLDAAVQRDLLVSLFIPEGVNKLHDGAVVIRNFRVAKAGVFFPMPDTKVLDKSLGSRHRSALGITEETDAVVVVVSEERGTISFCFNGNIVSGLDGASLKQALLGLFGKNARGKAKKPGPERERRGSSIRPPTPGPMMPAMIPTPRPILTPLAAMHTPLPLSSPPVSTTLRASVPPPAPESVPVSTTPPREPETRPMAPAAPIEPTPMSVRPPPPMSPVMPDVRAEGGPDSGSSEQ
jgi:diadenylate cyclase